MGYKIWRKDKYGWELAFDTVYPTREKVDERIAELNAVYHDMVRNSELQFHPYREDIKLAKDGSVIDPYLQAKALSFTKKSRKNKRYSVVNPSKEGNMIRTKHKQTKRVQIIG